MTSDSDDDAGRDHTLHVRRTGPRLVHDARLDSAPLRDSQVTSDSAWQVLRDETARARARIPHGCGGCEHAIWHQKQSPKLLKPASGMEQRDPRMYQHLFEPNVSCTIGARPSPAGVAYCSRSTAQVEVEEVTLD